jgi:glycine/D-amino acid oxidase-like deaminating enzyme
MAYNSNLHDSLWANNAPPINLPSLQHRTRGQVVVIGGGYTGCVAALKLADRGIDVVLLEAKEIGWGGSGRNSGLVNAGLWLDPSAVEDHLGEAYGQRLVKGLSNTPAMVRELIERHEIDCDVSRSGIVKAAHRPAALGKIEETVRQWQSLSAPVELLSSTEISRLTGTAAYPGGLLDHRSFTIEPLAYARGLAQAATMAGARLFVESPVCKIEPTANGVRVTTNRAEVVADRAIVATGAYDDQLIKGMQRAFVPLSYFLFATEPLSENLRQAVLPGKIAIWDTSPSLLTLRYDRHFRLLVGNLGWLPSAPKGHKWALSVVKSTFPQIGDIRFTHGWSGMIDFTNDHIPWLARPMPNVHMVGGFNGRGIGPGAYWGAILADWVAGMPDDSLPVPVNGPPAVRLRSIKQYFYSTAFQVSRVTDYLLRH